MKEITKWHEMPFGLSKKGVDHWENNGWGMYLVSDDGVEFLIWTSPYIINSGKEFAINILTVQTMLAMYSGGRGPANEVLDNPFIYKGWDLHDHLTVEDVRIIDEPTGVTWSFKQRLYSYKGNHRWKLSGCDAGVCFDLDMNIFKEPIWYLPADSDPLVNGEAWFWAFADINGWLSVNEKKYNVKGWGIHERHIVHGNEYQLPQETKGEGFYWMLGLGEGYRFILSSFAGRGLELYLLTKDHTLKAANNDISVEVLEKWTDTRSKFTVPTKWRVVSESSEVYLNAVFKSYLRAYYPWTFMKSGNTVLYFFLTYTEGHFVDKTKSLITRLESGRGYVHMNWMFHRRS